jgi:hypothetical protein
MESHLILEQPVASLGFQEKFCVQCLGMGFHTISDVIATPPEQIVLKKEFSFSWLGELSEFLNKHSLLHLLQPVPGKSSC